ncbi:MAG: sel1 repeat family protein [Rhodocyclaceae bacterium]|nr:sel1 repeat family protein [Rhodocyclaceae bacterium]MCA3860341.1 sel1 repeat family protein [Burkholderia sp.]
MTNALALALAGSVLTGCDRSPAGSTAANRAVQDAQGTSPGDMVASTPSPQRLSEAALARCDELAADPDDPNRYGAGVPAERFAPGAAVEACQQALERNPGHPRAMFQLGRAFWLARKDDQGFDHLFNAAQLGYGPAMKVLGDAYIEGRGLPNGERRDFDIAIQWYEKARIAGHPLAERAAAEAMAAKAKSTFDQSIFQYGEGMALLYSGAFERTKSPVYLAAYTAAVVQTLSSETILFLDQACKPLVNKVGMIAIDFMRAASYLAALRSADDLVIAAFSHFLSPLAQDQGQRDAVTLMRTYGCESEITKKVVDNVMIVSMGRGKKS